MFVKMATFFIIVVFVYIGLVGMLYFQQRKMMYFTGVEKPSVKDSGIVGLEEITVHTDDGLSLFGWYRSPSRPENPTIVWFHGNASNVAITAERALPYMIQGYGLLAVEYRGYVSNPGNPTEQGLYKDGRAFINWLKQKTPENSIIIYGESIGTGTAVQMATEYPSIHTLVVEAPFTSTVDAATFHYPYVPVKWLLKDRYENLSKIEKIKSPLIVVYGDQDRIIPHILGEQLFKAAPEPKSLVVIAGGDHNDLDSFGVSEKIIALLSE